MIKRIMLIILFLTSCFFILNAQQNSVPYVYGWSVNGTVAIIEPSGNISSILIIDLVTDEILLKKELSSNSNGELVLLSEDIEILEELAIERVTGQKETESFFFQNNGYNFDKTIRDDLNGSRVIYQTLILSIINRTMQQKKVVYSFNASGGEELIDFDISSVYISPYEKRCAIIVKETRVVDSVERISWRVIGAHLTIGFDSISSATDELIEAVLCGQYYICRNLLNSGAVPDSSVDNRGYSSLMLAVRNDKWKIAELLLQYGATARWQDEEGFTPLHYAAKNGQFDLCNLLLSRGADKNSISNNGQTAAQIARNQGHMDIYNLLK